MNREYKFRVYCKILNAYFIKFLNSLLANPERECEIPTNYEIRGQYIGLTDKNDKEICEGDILSYPDVMYLYPSRKIIGVVKYNKEKAGFFIDTPGHWHDFKEMEIIGNIYENPDLIEEDKGTQCK